MGSDILLHRNAGTVGPEKQGVVTNLGQFCNYGRIVSNLNTNLSLFLGLFGVNFELLVSLLVCYMIKIYFGLALFKKTHPTENFSLLTYLVNIARVTKAD